MVANAFDYTPLNGFGAGWRELAKNVKAWHIECKKHGATCRKAAQDAGEVAIKIGSALAEKKDEMPHGLWHHWLESECGFPVRTAQYYIAISEKFKYEPGSHLGISVLRMLAGDSVPQSARDEAVERSLAGETITKSEAERIIESHAVALDRTSEAQDPENSAVKPQRRRKKKADSEAPVAPAEPEIKAERSQTELMNDMLSIAKQLDPEKAVEVAKAILRLYGPKSAEVPAPKQVTPEPVAPRAKGSLLEFDAADMKVPDKFEGDRFRKAWQEWVQYNAEEGHPLTESVAGKQMKELAQRSIDAAINAIDKAISTRAKSFPTAKETRPKFVPPTVQEVRAYVEQSGFTPKCDPERFVAYFETQGWKLANGNSMSDWKAAVRSWVGRRDEEAQKRPTGSAATNGAYEKFVSDRMKPNAPSPQPSARATRAPVESSTRRPA